MPDEKQIIQGALDTAGAIAFAIPGAEPFAALAAIVSFFVGFVPDDPGPPPPPPVTEDDLKDALSGLKENIIDALWDNRLDNGKDDLLANLHQFRTVWSGLTGANGPQYNVPASVLTFQSGFDVGETYQYFNTADQDAIWVKLVAFRDMLEAGDESVAGVTADQVVAHQRKTVGLYCLASSLLIAYLKGAVIWHWSNTLAKNRRIAKYNTAVNDWENMTPVERATALQKDAQSAPDDKYRDLIDQRTGKVVAPISWKDFCEVEIGPVSLLKDQVQLTMAYLVEQPADGGNPAKDGVYTEMRRLWEDLDTKMGGYRPSVMPTVSTMNWSDLQQAVKTGYQQAQNWERDLAALQRLSGVKSSDELELIVKVIRKLRTIGASVSFKEHKTVANDTLSSLAQFYYKDVARAQAIADTNADILGGGSSLSVGLVLRIYDPDVVDYAPRPKPPAATGGN